MYEHVNIHILRSLLWDCVHTAVFGNIEALAIFAEPISFHRIQNSLYKLFEHKCALEVCVHIHPIMIKIHPVDPPSSNQAVLRFLSE